MHNFDTINQGNYIKSYEFLDEIYEDYYEPLDIEEDEIEYE